MRENLCVFDASSQIPSSQLLLTQSYSAVFVVRLPLFLLCVCLISQSQKERVRATHKMSAEQCGHYAPPPYRPCGDETHQLPNSRYSKDAHTHTLKNKNGFLLKSNNIYR